MSEGEYLPGSERLVPIGFEKAWHTLQGHGFGLHGPAVHGVIYWPRQVDWNIKKILTVLQKSECLPAQKSAACLSAGLDLQAFFALVYLCEVHAKTLVKAHGIILSEPVIDGVYLRYQVAFPTFDKSLTLKLIKFIANCVQLSDPLIGEDAIQQVIKKANSDLSKARLKVPMALQKGVNTTRLIEAAHQMKLPWRWLKGDLVQIGAGTNARLFASTLTEDTPALGAKSARSKWQTASLLRENGLPATRHYPVKSLEQAIGAAEQLGYPVVLKPDNLDGGLGVHAGLQNMRQLVACYQQAAEVSAHLLVEKHVEGQDYRLTVDNGCIVKAIRRVPGGVTGDGQHTVSQLVEGLRAAAASTNALGRIVSLDDEAQSLLEAQGLGVDSVLPNGVFLPLRRRANMSTGGTGYDVLTTIHPDNARLAIRAARALRLDLAGVDLIMPDIAESWLESTAAICEVNAQPQISTEFAPDVYHNLLRRWMPPPVRLRAVLLLQLDNHQPLDSEVADVSRNLAAQGERVFSVQSDGIWLDGQKIGIATDDLFTSARSAECNTEATAVVAALPVETLVNEGLPWFSVDQVCVVDRSCSDASMVKSLLKAIRMFAPHLRQDLVLAADLADAIQRTGELPAVALTALTTSGQSALNTDWVRGSVNFPTFAAAEP